MAWLLIILTILICVGISWYLQRLDDREAQARPVKPRLDDAGWASDLRFHPGHSWIRRRDDGLITVGASAFCARFLGEPARVELPAAGTQLREGQEAWTLVSRAGRRLVQRAPVSGEVVGVNYDLIKEPDLLARSPHGVGWLLVVRPYGLEQSLASFFSAELAEAWRGALRDRLVALLSPVGLAATDGGELVRDLGDQLDDETWHRLQAELFPAGGDRGSVV